MSRLNKFGIIAAAALASCSQGENGTNNPLVNQGDPARAAAGDPPDATDDVSTDVSDEVSSVLDGGVDGEADAADASVNTDAGDAASITGVTRREVAQLLVGDVMGFEQEPCTVQHFKDVPLNDPACFAVHVLFKRGAINGFADGTFKPDQTVNFSEEWKMVAQGIGFPPFESACLSQNPTVVKKSWYAPYAGALCARNLSLFGTGAVLNADAGADGGTEAGADAAIDADADAGDASSEASADAGVTTTDPAAKVTQDHLQSLKNELLNYLATDMLKVEAIEVGGFVVGGRPLPESPLTCKSVFTDVPDKTVKCAYVNEAFKKGIVTGVVTPTGRVLGGYNPVNHAEYAKIFTLNTGFPISPETGCAAAPTGAWYAPFMDTLCNRALIDNTWGPAAGQTVTKRIGYKTAWDFDLTK